jgi:bisphosphoglycerate-independent phosphoglycerate mutase (AlkP superfamily)
MIIQIPLLNVPAIKEGSFFKNTALNKAMDAALKKNGALHLGRSAI